jgi:uncharacterized protein YeaO (DUF488 family)
LIKIKRIYKPADPSDGYRVLVDRLWPRGLSKGKANVDLWLRDIAPSDDLRKWYHHDLEKWPEFKKRYFNELSSKKKMIDQICEREKGSAVTLLFSSKEEMYNNAQALKEYLEKNELYEKKR